jgi:uncharacterized membrane protein
MFGGSVVNNASLREDVKVVVENDIGVVYDSEISKNNYPSHFVGYSYENDFDERGLRIKCENGASYYCDSIFYYNRDGFAKVTTFTYEYTIEGVITQYNDISELNWILLDYQPFEFNDITINITLPKGNYSIENADTFFHGTNKANREFASDNKIVITSEDTISDEQIEVRLLLNNEVFSDVREENKVNVNAKDAILSFEKEQTELADKKFFVGNTVAIIIYAIYVLIICFIAFIAYKKYDKEYVSDFYNEYYRELPADYSPAVMGYLYKFRNIDDDDLSATLLDLIRRKYLI